MHHIKSFSILFPPLSCFAWEDQSLLPPPLAEDARGHQEMSLAGSQEQGVTPTEPCPPSKGLQGILAKRDQQVSTHPFDVTQT